MKTDIVVIGGGASGIAAALEIKKQRPDTDVVIAERLDRIGKKILATGNGRCNLTNRDLSAGFYHGSVKNMNEIIHNTEDSVDFFRSLGVLCTADEEGRVYPYSKSAASVLNALRLKLASYGVREECGFYVTGIEKNKGGYIVISEDGRRIFTKKIIVSCGGYASPVNGTDGNAIKLFRQMGYRTEKICPAVAPLRTSPEALKGLKGVRTHGKVSALSSGKVISCQTGEIQFTENSLSGICVFNLAYLFSVYEGNMELEIDFLPELAEDEVRKLFMQIKNARAEHTIEDFLSGVFVKNLSLYITKRFVPHPFTDKISSITEKEISKLAQAVKSVRYTVTGCSSWQNAQATAGGISGSCVDEQLCSKKDSGIYFAGEILDVDGECGGYNLEWAWSSGKWAGKYCALSL